MAVVLDKTFFLNSIKKCKYQVNSVNIGNNNRLSLHQRMLIFMDYIAYLLNWGTTWNHLKKAKTTWNHPENSWNHLKWLMKQLEPPEMKPAKLQILYYK